MFIRYIKPSGMLARYIKYYWVLEIEATDGEVCERVVPTGTIELMFHYRQPFTCKATTGWVVQPRSFISGMAGTFTDVQAEGDSGVIAVTFRPFGASNFFKFPLTDIENANIDLHDIDCNANRRLEAQLDAANTTSTRINLIERFLHDRFRPLDHDDQRFMLTSLSLINNRYGNLPISGLLEKLGCSEKSLERKFSRLIGTTPKRFMRIIRFQHVIHLLSRADEPRLSSLALESGYFDQAHFINDFKALSGYTPRDFCKLGPCLSDYFY